ncbi:sensor domain-containing diguanylate cyclase [Novosphingobium rosa]|uniref:sensor domain-containing diguanylate cyclase n=1 Tax=Novosphingobium rosa TaxID=76978 RepID=UPI000A06D00A|nr:sensor domain-containing diguanylate cyclase [Novosphingobium rosa]
MLSWIRTLLGGGRKAELARKEAATFRMLAEHNNDVIFRCSARGIAHYVSPSAERVLGWPADEIIGKGPADFVLPEDLPLIMAAQSQHQEGDESSPPLAYRVRRKDDTVVWVEGSARRVIAPESGEHELVIVMRDITERKQLEEQLSRLAMTDGLTGLANRRAFDAALDHEWLRTRRGNGQLSLLLMDLDHFKAFNDRYGHQVGDDCLRAVASAIQSALRRPADLAARYGGEELAVILPDTDAAGAVQVAEAIRNAVQALAIPHSENAGGIVTISTGVATALSRTGASIQMPSSLLQAADTALYKAKSNGRNRVETALLLSGEGSPSAAA